MKKYFYLLFIFISIQNAIGSTPDRLFLSELQQCDDYFKNEDYKSATECYEANLKYYNIFSTEYDLSLTWASLSNYFYGQTLLESDTAWSIDAYRKALQYSASSGQEDKINSAINDWSAYLQLREEQKNAPTNDYYAYKQKYLTALNIPNAWKKVTKSHEAVVAIIDDGIFFNHPDLKGKIWFDPKAEYGANKIINFVWDTIGDNRPVWQHWSMIAGIIGAITNNTEGIAWIAKNVKMMPLRVFDFEGRAKDDNIIRAMNYAIDNGANIINLSLWWSQFDSYTSIYDDVIKRAYDRGVVVVIAAGNGDLLTKSRSWVDLNTNPISPVCNNKGNTQYSIGVGSTDNEGKHTSWTNYNWCISIYAPGVWIISTSIPIYNSEYGTSYNVANGTSFSAPIISGIIALWYNQFGYVAPKKVQEAILNSRVKNSLGRFQIDAARYIDELAKVLSVPSATPWSTDANILANSGIINRQNTDSAYNLSHNVLRQEVIGMAIKLGNIPLPSEYACKNIFWDVASNRPNSWACRVIEIAANNNVVSTFNKTFRPESYITRAEALWILLKASHIPLSTSRTSRFSDVTVEWQVNVVNTALSYGFIDAGTYFNPNKNATRGEIFAMARRILESQS